MHVWRGYFFPHEFLCINFTVAIHSFPQLDEHTLHFLSFFKTLTAHTCFYTIMEFRKVFYSRMCNTIQIAHARYNEPVKWENHKTSPRCCYFRVSLLNVCNTPDVPTNAKNPTKAACGSQREESAWVPSSLVAISCVRQMWSLLWLMRTVPVLTPHASSLSAPGSQHQKGKDGIVWAQIQVNHTPLL